MSLTALQESAATPSNFNTKLAKVRLEQQTELRVVCADIQLKCVWTYSKIKESFVSIFTKILLLLKAEKKLATYFLSL
jgi:hypothetical protein